MKYIFFGTPEFAAIILERLIRAGLPPVALVANPDRPMGRKRVLTPPETKRLVQIRNEKLDKKIEILQPESLDTSLISHLSSLNPDFFVVAAYAKIIPQEILSLAPQGVIGVHPSLLPELRGASPIQGAILTGARTTGVTLYLMDAKMDHGPIIAQEPLATYDPERATYPELLRDLARLAGTMAEHTLPRFAEGKTTTIEQHHDLATFTKKFSTESAFVPAEELDRAASGDAALAEKIDRLIRALNPEPGAWTIKGGKRIKLLAAQKTGETLRLTRIQPEGKRPYDLG